MPLHWKLVIDCADPHRQADFWAAALGYDVEDNSALITALLESGYVSASLVTEHHGRRAWRDAAAVRHPDDPVDPASGTGLGRRLLFNRVPEPKPDTKNRLHIDIHTEADDRPTTVDRLTNLGATVVRHVDEPAGSWSILKDPEGNEFCVH
ncbi:VOC family protein [Streptomyces alkaliterrae]|uniref:VOC family protein n=1 Tax=Streptomyces alkaliterrae TaxID=2213162 RepID=A0A5P0YZ11_9ACTN|nr:VOC family protein [Streptomyces alkaliterrae]MBB1257064.1 VOC family protein [Streptomyces alkaliterrae]MBB1262470.1 VOC family protein [Streptomyces alkaliterrae]MQS05503.1 hypothetical protein [Streptomyces alkaliterrae]